ncbi:MAG: Mur ligase domain-containing protein, partial [Phycisphaeraceae bacterium]|nr:Mur ligase domain-containing protein [Phycisphaeraceae bacterium]
MKLSDLIADQPICMQGRPGDGPIQRIVDDSRQAGPGTLFVARAGRGEHGRRYIADALKRGAEAVLTDRPPEEGQGLPLLLCDRPMAVALDLARRLHGHPTRHLKLIGITGTNGKTTVAFLIRHL